MSDTIHFVAVLRSGGSYSARYVNNLFDAIVQNVRAPFTFTVLTDLANGFRPAIRIVPLRQSWPGWWSKMEMFQPGLWTSGRVWYFDLDTLIVRDITTMITDERYGDDFYTIEDLGKPGRLASGIMTWKVGDPVIDTIYTEFCKNQANIMSSCCSLGDQCWIGIITPTRHYIQALHKDRICSFNKHCGNGLCVQNYDIICFHGKPRPHEAARMPGFEWVRNYWR